MHASSFWKKHQHDRAKRLGLLKSMLLLLAMMQVGNSYAADVLDGLITESIQSYPSIKSKEMSQESAQIDVKTAKLGFFPTASLTYEPRRKIYGGLPNSNSGKDAYTVISVTQPILGGGLVSTYRQSQANLSAADWALREEAENVALRVITAYATWYGANEKVRATKESVKEYDHFVGLISRRAEAGASPLTDKNLAVSRLLQAQAELNSYQSLETASLSVLSQLLDRPLTSDELLRTPSDNLDPPFFNDVIEQAVAINPSVKRLEFVSKAANQASEAQRAQAYPQLALQVKREIGDLNINDMPSRTTVGFVVNYTTGAGFSSLSRADSAFSRYRAALMDVETAKRDLVVKVNQDLSDYSFAKNRVVSLVENVDLTKMVSQSYDRLFFVGKKSWLDLMNSVRERKDTQLALADAQAQVLLTSRRLRVYTQGLDFDTMGLSKLGE